MFARPNIWPRQTLPQGLVTAVPITFCHRAKLKANKPNQRQLQRTEGTDGAFTSFCDIWHHSKYFKFTKRQVNLGGGTCNNLKKFLVSLTSFSTSSPLIQGGSSLLISSTRDGTSGKAKGCPVSQEIQVLMELICNLRRANVCVRACTWHLHPRALRVRLNRKPEWLPTISGHDLRSSPL